MLRFQGREGSGEMSADEETLKKLRSDKSIEMPSYSLSPGGDDDPFAAIFRVALPPICPPHLKKRKEYKSNKSECINYIIYSNPEAEARRIKVAETFKQKSIQALKKLLDEADPTVTHIVY